MVFFFFFSSRRRHTRSDRDWSSDVCSSDLFQGQEMLENQQFSSSRPMDWTKTNTYSGIVKCYRDLIRLRRNVEGYSAGLKGDQFSFLKVDTANKVIVSRRWKTGVLDSDVVVVANLTS